jgi:hypothetical protein
MRWDTCLPFPPFPTLIAFSADTFKVPSHEKQIFASLPSMTLIFSTSDFHADGLMDSQGVCLCLVAVILLIINL